MEAKNSLSLHVWTPNDELDTYRMEWQGIGEGNSFGFNISDESLRRLVIRLAQIVEEGKRSDYMQLVFDITDDVDVDVDSMGDDLE